MNIVLIGSGGREHSLAKKIKESKHVERLFIMPGNAGTFCEGQNININAVNFKEIAEFSLENNVEMVVVGPEAPLADGFHDFFAENDKYKNIKVIGPKKFGAQLESSKDFAKQFMKKHNIPTAKYETITKSNISEGKEFLKTLNSPYVLKADGLAAGKGVLIIDDLTEAENALEEMLNGKFGDAGNKVVIEEFLDGIEVSVFVLTDGKDYKILPEAKDYKRIGEGDTGLNTGGMGAVSPVPFADKAFMKKVEDKVIAPTIKGIRADNIDYNGFIFFGLIKVNDEPYVIEYNVRMGDPESEVVIPRIKSDLVDLFIGVADKNIKEKTIEFVPETATTVMLVSKGYPEAYEKSKEITNLDKVSETIVYHAGTIHKEGKVLSNGGRVIALTSFGKNIAEALKQSYKSAEIIDFENKHYRKDIGFDL